MKIAQRFCQCGGRNGFTLDERSGMWVCGICHLPGEVYYIAMRSAQPPGKKIKFANGIETPKSQRGRLKSHP